MASYFDNYTTDEIVEWVAVNYGQPGLDQLEQVFDAYGHDGVELYLDQLQVDTPSETPNQYQDALDRHVEQADTADALVAYLGDDDAGSFAAEYELEHETSPQATWEANREAISNAYDDERTRVQAIHPDVRGISRDDDFNAFVEDADGDFDVAAARFKERELRRGRVYAPTFDEAFDGLATDVQTDATQEQNIAEAIDDLSTSLQLNDRAESPLEKHRRMR